VGWDSGELAEDDDDNSDYEFELRMWIDSSDNDREELRNSRPSDEDE
jgi:hypothetical protein